jgi:hypothetical protein
VVLRRLSQNFEPAEAALMPPTELAAVETIFWRPAGISRRAYVVDGPALPLRKIRCEVVVVTAAPEIVIVPGDGVNVRDVRACATEIGFDVSPMSMTMLM